MLLCLADESEHFGGELPVWLAPVQAIVLPIADRHIEYAESVRTRMVSAGLRAEVDGRPESVSKKVRDAELGKIPFLLVVERRMLREAPIMRGVAAGRSAQRSGAATGGGGPAGLP